MAGRKQKVVAPTPQPRPELQAALAQIRELVRKFNETVDAHIAALDHRT